MFKIGRMCFSNRLTIHKVITKFGTALSSRIGRTIAIVLNFYVSHSSATIARCLINGSWQFHRIYRQTADRHIDKQSKFSGQMVRSQGNSETT